MPPPATEPSLARRALPWLALTLLYTALTCVYFWPLPRLGGDHIGPDLGDPLFNLWVLKWGAHQIGLGLPDVWDANIFYPTKGTLAFSDHLLGPAAQLFLFLKVVPNAIAGYNFLLLSSFVGDYALAVCWMLRRGGLSWIAAGLRRSDVRLLLLPAHPALARPDPDRAVDPAHPLVLGPPARPADGAGRRAVPPLLPAQPFRRLLFAYMIHFPLAAIFLSRSIAEGEGPALLASATRPGAGGPGDGGGAAAVFFLPYARVAREREASQAGGGDQDLQRHARQLLQPQRQKPLFRRGSGTASWDASPRCSTAPRPRFYAGFLPTFLFLIGVLFALRGPARRSGRPLGAGDRALRPALLRSLLRAVLRAARPVVPGLSGMRVPARFYAFVSLTLVYFAARGADLLLRRAPSPERAPGPRRRARRRPHRRAGAPAHRMRTAPPGGGAAASLRLAAGPARRQGPDEAPLYFDARENQYLYASTLHWKPIANGYSGYMAESYTRLANRIAVVPHAEGFDQLREDRVHPTSCSTPGRSPSPGSSSAGRNGSARGRSRGWRRCTRGKGSRSTGCSIRLRKR